jgi:hypothetical protein
MNDTNNINKYYNLVDTNYINNLCKNSNLKNLINLSIQTDLYIFDKKKKKNKLKNKLSLLKECDKIKKKEIKNSSNMLSNLAKICKNNDDIYNNPVTEKIKNIYKTLENKINNIDEIVNVIKIIDIDDANNSKSYEIDNLNESIFINLNNIEGDITTVRAPSSEKYIEFYSNC